jgi:hypothetical protein
MMKIVGLASVVMAALLLSGCVTRLHPSIPELFYRGTLPAAPDSVCADISAALIGQANLARDSSYEVALGGSRCHEILYASDGNEVWLQLRGDELTIAVRNYPQPGDLELPSAASQALADSVITIVRDRYPGAAIQKSEEKDSDS